MEEVELISEVGADYTTLRDLLASGNWREADNATDSIMQQIGCKESRWVPDSLLDSELAEFPLQDLRTIDRLWVHYSGGRFGFSVQMKIYTEVGKDQSKFMQRVGWAGEYWAMNWGLGLNAPLGCLPRAALREEFGSRNTSWADSPGRFFRVVGDRLTEE